MEGKDKLKIVLILSVAIFISVVLGFGSSGIVGHEVVIFPLLEGTFLIIYTIALVLLSISCYKRNDKKTGKRILLSSLAAVILGSLAFAVIYYYG